MTSNFKIKSLLAIAVAQLPAGLAMASQYPDMVGENAIVYFAKNGIKDDQKAQTRTEILKGDKTKLKKMMEQLGELSRHLSQRKALGLEPLAYYDLQQLAGFFAKNGLPGTDDTRKVQEYAKNCIEAKKFLKDEEIIQYIDRKLPPVQWGGSNQGQQSQQKEENNKNDQQTNNNKLDEAKKKVIRDRFVNEKSTLIFNLVESILQAASEADWDIINTKVTPDGSVDNANEQAARSAAILGIIQKDNADMWTGEITNFYFPK